MASEFAVHLGGGTYLDASGNITFSPPEDAQLYPAPEGFHIDSDKLKETFKSLSELLPEDEAAQKKWMEWGVPKGLVEALASIAGITSIAATAVSVYFWAIGAVLSIMKLVTGEDGLSPAMKAAFHSIKNQMKAQEQIQLADAMLDLHSKFEGPADLLMTKVVQLSTEAPSGDARAQIFKEMQAIVDQLAQPLSRLRNEDWNTAFDPEDYKGRAFLSHLLVTVGPNATTTPLPLGAPVTGFNYRLGIPMMLYGFTTFHSMLRTAMPWFRSSGMHSNQLRKCADSIDRFVMRVQNEGLARTLHTPETLLGHEVFPTFEIPSNNNPVPFGLGPKYYPVGAFDLFNYHDRFLTDRWVEQFNSGGDLGLRGAFDYSWQPTQSAFDKIVEEANDRARQDYADLQAVSGIFHLMQLAALLRYLSTPPVVSETVVGKTGSSRNQVSEEKTTAKSQVIFPSTVIEAPATLKHYQSKANAAITTQEPGYTPAFRYRICLRTADSKLGGSSWRKTDYVQDVWNPRYEKTAASPRDLCLVSNTGSAFLTDIVLYEGPAPVETVPRQGRATLNATTFDWYVPMLGYYGPLVGKKIDSWRVVAQDSKTTTAAATKPFGGRSIHLNWSPADPMPVMSGDAPLFQAASDLWDVSGTAYTLDEVSLDRAERRNVRTEEVHLDWELTWTRGHLQVRLAGDPKERPFQAYIVVEERVHSGNSAPDGVDPLQHPGGSTQLHTPFVAEIVNQLVLVPEYFFIEEKTALEEGEKLWDFFIKKYSEMAQVGPLDPIASMLDGVRQQLSTSESTATLVDSLNTRLGFMRSAMPAVFEAKMAELRPSIQAPADLTEARRRIAR